jgi:hypothetical protein
MDGPAGAPAQNGRPVTDPSPQAARRGWWRRNWWGLLILPVVLAGALYSPVKDGYDQFWGNRPRIPVTTSPGGWVDYAGGRIRVVQLARPNELRTSNGRVVTLPDQVVAWRATIEFSMPKTDAIGGCTITLEAGNGAQYAANPPELDDLFLNIATCTPDLDATPAPTYQVVVYFVLPRSVSPAAVRVAVSTQLPRYTRLIPPAI